MKAFSWLMSVGFAWLLFGLIYWLVSVMVAEDNEEENHGPPGENGWGIG